MYNNISNFINTIWISFRFLPFKLNEGVHPDGGQEAFNDRFIIKRVEVCVFYINWVVHNNLANDPFNQLIVNLFNKVSFFV